MSLCFGADWERCRKSDITTFSNVTRRYSDIEARSTSDFIRGTHTESVVPMSIQILNANLVTKREILRLILVLHAISRHRDASFFRRWSRSKNNRRRKSLNQLHQLRAVRRRGCTKFDRRFPRSEFVGRSANVLSVDP